MYSVSVNLVRSIKEVNYSSTKILREFPLKNAGLSYFSMKIEKMFRMHTLSQNFY